MFHDKHLAEAASEQLFSLGEGQIGYVRLMREEELSHLPPEANIEKAWGVFSATGETLAICDSPAAAWSFFADHQLMPVSVH